MPSATPALALPYPLGTDRVSDGDDAIKALAERTEAILAPAWSTSGISFVGGTFATLAAPDHSRIRVMGKHVRCEIRGTYLAAPPASGNFGNFTIGTVAAPYLPGLGARIAPVIFVNSAGFNVFGAILLDTGAIQLWGTVAAQSLATGVSLRTDADWYLD